MKSDQVELGLEAYAGLDFDDVLDLADERVDVGRAGTGIRDEEVRVLLRYLARRRCVAPCNR